VSDGHYSNDIRRAQANRAKHQDPRRFGHRLAALKTHNVQSLHVRPNASYLAVEAPRSVWISVHTLSRSGTRCVARDDGM
jgi:hypothetical protein